MKIVTTGRTFATTCVAVHLECNMTCKWWSCESCLRPSSYLKPTGDYLGESTKLLPRNQGTPCIVLVRRPGCGSYTRKECTNMPFRHPRQLRGLEVGWWLHGLGCHLLQHATTHIDWGFLQSNAGRIRTCTNSSILLSVLIPFITFLCNQNRRVEYAVPTPMITPCFAGIGCGCSAHIAICLQGPTLSSYGLARSETDRALQNLHPIVYCWIVFI